VETSQGVKRRMPFIPAKRSGMMKKLLSIVAIFGLASVWSAGCQKSPLQSDASTGAADSTVGTQPAIGSEEHAHLMLCGHCGQVKGTDECCKDGAEKCAACSLAKGSPGCCKIPAGTDVALCEKCGHIAKTEACCQEGAETCEKCGLAKGSPGCCKAPAKTAS
jgi:hypothetical protein